MNNDLRQGQKPPERFSHMLRRRFSRESKSSGEHREPSKFTFPFTLKPSRSMVPKSVAELAALDQGSSLMSERGYDSDAQFISTPTRAGHLGRSPVGRAMRRMELSDLIEQSQERSEAEKWAATRDPNAPESHESAFGMRFIPTPNSSLRGVPSGFHTPPETEDSRNRALASLEGRYVSADSGVKVPYVRSAQSFSSANQDEPSSAKDAPGSVNEATLMADWKKFLHASRQRYGMASSGSLPATSPDLVVAKTRQPSQSSRVSTDPQSVHLNDLDISNQLASRSVSSSSMSLTPSLTQLCSKNRHDRMDPSQENSQMRQASGASVGLQGRRTHSRDQSFCSRQSSAPPALISSSSQSLKQLEGKPMNCSASGEHTMVENVPAPEIGVLGRLRAHYDSGSSPLRAKGRVNGISTPNSTRKVSIGWMSEGRRVGYGYSLVEDDEGQGQPQKEGIHPRPSQTTGLKSEEVGILKEDVAKDPASSSGHIVHPTGSPGSSCRGHDTSPPGTSPLHVTGEAILPAARDSTKPASEYPAPSFLRAILGNRSNRDQDSKSTGVQEKSTEALRVPEMSLATENELSQGPQSSHHNADTTPARRWARLSRSMNVQPGSHKNRNEGQKTWIIGAPNPARKADITITVESPEEVEYHDAESGPKDLGQIPDLRPSPSRAAKWAFKLPRSRESRRVSTAHRDEPSQASSSTYEDCDSSSLKRGNSLESNKADDMFKMPGAFEGSRWATRISRMF